MRLQPSESRMMPEISAAQATKISLSQGLSLKLGEVVTDTQPYATSRLQRGLLLLDGDTLLSEEAVGFGVPVIKLGLRAIFPSEAAFDIHAGSSGTFIEARFRLNLVERFSRQNGGEVGSSFFYSVKDLLAAAIRRLPPTRSVLTTASSWLRHVFGWQTTYKDGDIDMEVTVNYHIEPPTGKIAFEVDCGNHSGEISEVVLMHEQGARSFDQYEDSAGIILKGHQIGPWDEVYAAEAWFASSASKILFKVERVGGMRLFRGRELIGKRLAWTGFGYSFHPAVQNNRHEITITKRA